MDFKEALIAHLDGKKVECSLKDGAYILFEEDFRGLDVVDLVAYVNDDRYKFRLAPRTIFVNGVEVPAPESVAPKVGVVYFSPNPSKKYLCCISSWTGDSFDMHRLTTKQIYLNKEDAIARAKAMLLTSDKEDS